MGAAGSHWRMGPSTCSPLTQRSPATSRYPDERLQVPLQISGGVLGLYPGQSISHTEGLVTFGAKQ